MLMNFIRHVGRYWRRVYDKNGCCSEIIKANENFLKCAELRQFTVSVLAKFYFFQYRENQFSHTGKTGKYPGILKRLSSGHPDDAGQANLENNHIEGPHGHFRLTSGFCLLTGSCAFSF